MKKKIKKYNVGIVGVGNTGSQRQILFKKQTCQKSICLRSKRNKKNQSKQINN